VPRRCASKGSKFLPDGEMQILRIETEIGGWAHFGHRDAIPQTKDHNHELYGKSI
jgi:hypothetical protein